MNTIFHNTTEQKDHPLTRADVEELIQRNGGSKDLPLAGVNLEGADLSNLILQQANLSGANLSGANLSGANLSSANLSRADLSSANLCVADLSSANLFEANLSRAFLFEANLSRAFLSKADLSRANLTNANLSGADLSRAFLSEANLGGAILIRSYLSEADLSKANLSGADLSSANLCRAILIGSYLNEANLSEADLSEASLNEANLSETIIRLSYRNLSALHTALSSSPETKPEKTAIEKRLFVFGIRIVEEPLTPYHLATVLMAVTELSTKCWLIAMNRFADLIEYTQTHDERFVAESQLRFTTITYNSPFQGNFDIQLNATNMAEGIVTALDGVTQVKSRLDKAVLENWEKAQQLKQVMDQADQERKRAQLELEHEKLALEREQIELERQKLVLERELLQTMEMRLDVQKKGIEYALDIATKTVVVLQPQADDERKGMLIQTLLPTILQLQNEDHLELVLPQLPPTEKEDDTKQQ